MSRSQERLAVVLPDICGDLFSFVIELQRGGQAADPVALRRRITDLLRDYESRGRRAGIPQDLTDQARYAIAALLDETVMTGSSTEVREEWAARPLALELFDDLNAGENFFRRLDEIRRVSRPDEHELGAMEVFATCISLGFLGENVGSRGLAQVEEILTGTTRQIAAAREDVAQALSPNWSSPETMKERVKRVPFWVVAAAAAALLLALMIVLGLLASSGREDLLSILRGESSN